MLKQKDILRQRERLARQLPSAAEIVRGSLLEKQRPLLGDPGPVAHHLDQRRPTAELERPLLPVFPLPVGSAAVV
jgi:hypothetical protein